MPYIRNIVYWKQIHITCTLNYLRVCKFRTYGGHKYNYASLVCNLLLCRAVSIEEVNLLGRAEKTLGVTEKCLKERKVLSREEKQLGRAARCIEAKYCTCVPQYDPSIRLYVLFYLYHVSFVLSQNKAFVSTNS